MSQNHYVLGSSELNITPRVIFFQLDPKRGLPLDGKVSLRAFRLSNMVTFGELGSVKRLIFGRIIGYLQVLRGELSHQGMGYLSQRLTS